MMKTKTHSFVITVRTDRACTKAHALREARDLIHGDFYCTAREDSDPEVLRVKSIRRLPTPQPR